MNDTRRTRQNRMILRHLLVVLLVEARRPLTIAELVEMLDRERLDLPARPSKTVSDSLRWEMRRGRVVRLGHSSYCAGTIPRTTLRRMRDLVSTWRVETQRHAPADAW